MTGKGDDGDVYEMKVYKDYYLDEYIKAGGTKVIKN